LPELVAYYRELWRAMWADGVVVHDKDMTPAQHRAVGESCIRDYQAKAIGLEREISFPLDDHGRRRMRRFEDLDTLIWDRKNNALRHVRAVVDTIREIVTTSESSRSGETEHL
jgi:hypothetical protein